MASLAADVVVVASDDEARLLASTAPRAEAFVFAPRTLKQILDRALALGHLAGVAREAMAWIADAERRLALAQRRVGVMKRATARPRVVILHGDDVLLSGGYWCADLIELAGGHPVLTESGDPPKPVTVDGVRAARPDLVVLAPLSSADLEERLGADVAVRRLPEEVEVLGPGPGVYRTVDVILEAVGRARTRR
ncbi:MAG TPA: ABC transporter substrate-binding protein [Rhodothermales bacterium]